MSSTDEQLLRRLRRLGVSTSREGIQALLVESLSPEDLLSSLLQRRHMRPRHREEALQILQELLPHVLPPEVQQFRDLIAAGRLLAQEIPDVLLQPWVAAWTLLQAALPAPHDMMLQELAEFASIYRDERGLGGWAAQFSDNLLEASTDDPTSVGLFLTISDTFLGRYQDHLSIEDHLSILGDRIVLLGRAGRLEEARPIMILLTQTSPWHPVGWLRWGMLLREQGQPEEAIAFMERGLRQIDDTLAGGDWGLAEYIRDLRDEILFLEE